MLIAWISTAVVWINLSHTDRRSWSRIILWSSAESRANHNLINAHHTQTSCREEQRGGSLRLNRWCCLHLPFSSLLFQLAFSLISMHTASSPRILPREESCANFSASRATVPTADTADLKNTNRTKKLSFSPMLPHCYHPIFTCLSLPVSSLRQCENIDQTSAATLPIPTTSLYLHHPSIQTVSLFRLHPFSLISASFVIGVWCSVTPVSICIKCQHLYTQLHPVF